MTGPTHRPCDSAVAAQAFAEEWIAAWNSHDLGRILSHYQNDFEMQSPLIVERLGRKDGTLRGKADIGRYWSIGLAAQPPLHFELIRVFRGIDILCILYRSVTRNRRVIEWLRFATDGLVSHAAGIYSETDTTVPLRDSLVLRRPPVLRDGVIELRPWGPDAKADELYAAVRESIATHAQWLPWITPIYARTDSEQWITHCAQTWQAGTDYAFQILDASAQTLIGGVGLSRIRVDEGTANLGYWVRASQMGRGYATRATQLLAQWGLSECGLPRIEIRMATDNLASQRVAEKAGATFEGVQRNILDVPKSANRDARQYSFVVEDLKGPLGQMFANAPA